MESRYRSRLPLDLALTLAPIRRGANDPTVRVEDGAWWRALRTPAGPATLRLAQDADGEVRIAAWGSGAACAIDGVPELLGARDSLDGFAPEGRLGALHKRFRGLRIGRARAVFETALVTALEQLVQSRDAHASHRRMVHAWSERAPGPVELWLPLAPDALSRREPASLREHGVGSKRAAAVGEIARRAKRLEETLDMEFPAARERLLAVRGIGPWTASKIARIALGDPDAVLVGDYHLPHDIVFAFTGAARGDDARMLELLAPYAGHRARVAEVIRAAGIHAPRFGPRRSLRRSW